VDKKLADEILEMLWSMREGGLKSYAELVERVGDKNAPETIKKWRRQGLLL
jgi:hypothetical protein